MKIVSASAMRELDRQTIDGGYVSGKVLMERAGKACAGEVLDFTEGLKRKFLQRFVILCGKGNNGGDGYVIAKALSEESNVEVVVLALFSPNDFSADARFHYEQMPSSVRLVESWDFSHGDCVIDCLLGTGVRGGVREPYLSLIKQVNEICLPTISIDICSGVNGDDGSICNVAIEADLTICIGLPKVGNVFGDGGEISGVLKCVDIGFPKELVDKIKSEGELFLEEDALLLRKRPKANAHKYNRGAVFVVGGSNCYSGAPLLAVEAAMRSGAGMGKVLMPTYTGDLYRHSLAPVQIPYVTEEGCLDGGAFEIFREHWKAGTALVIGPGMIGNASEGALFEKILEMEADIVIDAGALNFVASKQSKIKSHQGAVVLTPHDGELKRLMKATLNHDCIEDSSVAKLSSYLGVYLVKKGRLSRVFSPNGKISINSSGSSSLATAGTGDLLAGMIGAKLVDLNLDKLNAVCLAVYEHGCLGASNSLTNGKLIADDFLNYLSCK